MKKSLWIIVGAILVSAALPLAAWAEESGWKMPNLNPFGSSGPSATSSRASQPPTSGWKMPKLLPSTTATARPKRKANQPTTWNRMTNGTQSFFSKTADVLTPWDNKKPAPPQKVTGSNTAFTRNNPAKKDPKSSSSVAPASWWSGEKSDQPKTVNGFLSQPRPH
jgi:hypothetical protein